MNIRIEQNERGFHVVIRGADADYHHFHDFADEAKAASLAEKIEASEQAPAIGDPQRWRVEADLSRLFEILDIQSESLARPALKFHTDAGFVKVHVAGERSRNAGSLCVTDGGPYGQSSFYGWISKDHRHFEARADCPQWIRDLLFQFACDPQGYAAEYGRAHGACIFCEKELTDPVSVAFGYGSTCARRYSLPHGKRAAKAAGLELPDAEVAPSQDDPIARANEALKRHQCPADERWAEHDAQGIFLTYVCGLCQEAKLSTYRPEILTGYSQADIDEPIEPEEGYYAA